MWIIMILFHFCVSANNMLTGIIPSEIGKLTGLTKLSIYLNQLSGSIPSELGLLTELRFLQLSEKINRTIPAEVMALPKVSIWFL